jgi:hypothetical protein
MAQRKSGPAKGTTGWDKKVMGNRRDEKRINKMNDIMFGVVKTPDKIFAGGKSEFYPKKTKPSESVKKFVSKAVKATKNMEARARKRK